jgi:hypothetical protein
MDILWPLRGAFIAGVGHFTTKIKYRNMSFIPKQYTDTLNENYGQLRYWLQRTFKHGVGQNILVLFTDNKMLIQRTSEAVCVAELLAIYEQPDMISSNFNPNNFIKLS